MQEESLARVVPFLVWLYFWSGSEQSASPWAHLHLVSRDSPWSCWKQRNVVLFPGGERGSSPTSLFSRALIFILLSLCSHLHLGKEEQTSLCSQEGSVLPNPACGQMGHRQWRTCPIIKWWILVTMRHGLCRDHAQPCCSEHFVFELQYLGLFWPRLLGGCWADILPMSWAWATPCVVPCVELDGDGVFGCVMLWMSGSGPGSDYICTPQITWGGWLSPWDLTSVSQARLNTLLFGMAGYRKDFSYCSCSCICLFFFLRSGVVSEFHLLCICKLQLIFAALFAS